jgi:endo-1,4-beta-xylanase
MDPSIRGGIGMHRRVLLFLAAAMIVFPSVFLQTPLTSARQHPANGINASSTSSDSTTTLGALAELSNKRIGVYMNHWETWDPMYLKVLLPEFNAVAVGYEMSWSWIHPEKDRYDFDEADNLVRIAKANNMTIFWTGYPVWFYGGGNPEWLAYDNGNGPMHVVTDWNRTELLSILDDHIETVVGRYKGQIDYMIVANEVVETEWYSNNNSWYIGPQRSFWYNTIGPEYIAHAFNKVHEVDPSIKLILNGGFWLDSYPDVIEKQADCFYNITADLLKQKVPVNAIGIMYYEDEELRYNNPWIPDTYNFTRYEEIVQRFLDLGLEVIISEMAVPIHNPVTPTKLQHQAEIYQKVVDLMMRKENITTFLPIALDDKYDYLIWTGNWSSPYLFNDYDEPKPAYYAVKHRLQGNTGIYQHDFSDPAINPASPPPVDMETPFEPPIELYYNILTAKYQNTETWPLRIGSYSIGEFKSGDIMLVNITKFIEPNVSDYYDIRISSDGLDHVCDGSYSYTNHEGLIQGLESPYIDWLHGALTLNSRLTWDDMINNLQYHSLYSYNDSALEFVNNSTHFGFTAENDQYSRTEIWEKNTGIMSHFRYVGSNSAHPNLDFEIQLDHVVYPGRGGGELPVFLILAAGIGTAAVTATAIVAFKMKKRKADQEHSPSVAQQS